MKLVIVTKRTRAALLEETMRLEKKIFPKHESMAETLAAEALKAQNTLILALVPDSSAVSGYVLCRRIAHQRKGVGRQLHVYALDVEVLSERLGVSQQELVAGIARDHDHVALCQVFERTASAAAGKALDAGCSGQRTCRQACLLLLPLINERRRRFAPLLALEDGRSVLEHILHELFRPQLLDRVVVCVPRSLAASDSSARAAVAKTATRLGAAAKVAVHVLDVAESEGDVGALRQATRYFAGAPGTPRQRRSDGILVVGCDRIFDAPTIRMMAVAARSSPADERAAEPRLRVRALLDLDVDFVASPDNNDDEAANSDDDEQFAGIFAFLGDAEATLELLEPEPGEPEQQPPRQRRSLTALLQAVGAEKPRDAVAIDKVVASDYCSWRHAAAHARERPPRSVERQTRSRLHASATKPKPLAPYDSPPRSDVSSERESDCEYIGFSREPSLLASHGFQGFKVDTTLVELREPELVPEQQHQQHCASEYEPLLNTGSGAPIDGGGSDAQCETLELATEATVATEADLDTMRLLKNRAFLLQIGPDAQASPAACCRSDASLHQPMRLDGDEGVFLALPDALQRCEETEEAAARCAHGGGARRRRFSALPSALQAIKMEAVVQQPRTSARASAVSVNVVVRTQVPAVGYAILLTALCAISSQGAVQDLLVGVPPLLKVFWRMTGASLAFAPLAVHSLARSGWRLPRLSRRQLALFALCGVSYAVYNATFIVALSLTSVGHTYIFSNCHSLLLVLAKLALRQPLGPMELVGAGVGFAGGVVTTLDHAAAAELSTPLRHGPSTLGDMVAFAGAFAGVGYLMSAKRVRPHMGVFAFMWALVTTVAVLVLLVLLWDDSAAALPRTRTLSTDATYGLFGWVHHLGIEAYVVLVGSFAGTMGFVTSLRYFDPLVVSVTMLTEPVVATVIGVCVGVDELPGLLTFLGGAAVLVGCSLVLLATHKTCTRVDVSDTLVEPATLEALRPRGSSHRRHSAVHALHNQRERPFRVNYGSFP
ncbi:hypothetical protein PybrP1_001499 [[Pythium] brassicae (nom. inval.)]|nr:hypothetical protein PybrP1_001499 [[Pythium] brassicae (nom. inval.)]